ncbi:TonB-dependent receptor [Parasulfuritortus cantonensis]|uniref:TonB-dependent receptor n=1 Tax=Parasulfuritortus cantonensis TaxID=2528202 RepID=A0A4R1B4D1_9PROT|nr:TonB-dependent receptor [Parasulfuritortus cantonensis]TCJ12954.1 TonB-dependent receptor [Parasulfuritortus cantonensis]
MKPASCDRSSGRSCPTWALGLHGLAALLVLVHCPPALAAAADDRLERFLSMSLEDLLALDVTISTNTRQAAANAPGVVTVITAEDLKATGATNVVDALEGVPGVHVRASAFGFRPLVHFRGASASQTLLMVNGVPMRDLLWGFGIYWKGLPASMIERVEIIRGPGSSLYGADASAGVVNVITKTAGTIAGTELGARIGSYGTGETWLQHGGQWAGFTVGLTADLQTTDGHDPRIAADAEHSSASLAPGDAAYGWDSADLRLSLARGDWRLLADYIRHDDVEIGLTGAGVLDPTTQGADRRLNLGLLYDNEQFAHDWSLHGELRYQHLDYDSGSGFQERPPGYTNTSAADTIADGTYVDGLINRMRVGERQFGLEAKAGYTGLADQKLLVGAGFSREDLYKVEQWVNYGIGPDGSVLPVNSPLTALSDTPYAFAPERARDIRYLYLQDIWRLAPAWELTLGARYDHYSDFGATFNPRTALVWNVSDRLVAKLMYGESFRPPSYQELYSPTSLALPNPDLRPEQSNTWDLAFSYAVSRDLRFGANLFRYRIKDLIARIEVSPGVRQYRNTGDHDIRGIGLEAGWQASPDLRFSGNVTWRFQDDSPCRDYTQPGWDAYLRGDWSFRRHWNWNLQANLIGSRPRNPYSLPADTRSAVPAYTVVDTTLRYAPRRDWEFALSLRNLFDADARESTPSAIPDDLPLPGRHGYAELRYKF